MQLPTYRPGAVQSLGRQDVTGPSRKASARGAGMRALQQGIGALTAAADEISDDEAKVSAMRADAAYQMEMNRREMENKNRAEYDPAEIPEGIPYVVDPKTGKVRAYEVGPAIMRKHHAEMRERYGAGLSPRARQYFDRATVGYEARSDAKATAWALDKKRDHVVTGSATALDEITANVTRETWDAARQTAIAHAELMRKYGISEDNIRKDFQARMTAIDENVLRNDINAAASDFAAGNATGKQVRDRIAEIKGEAKDPEMGFDAKTRRSIEARADAVLKEVRTREREDRSVLARGRGQAAAADIRNRYPGDVTKQLEAASNHRKGDNSPTAVLEREAAITAIADWDNKMKTAERNEQLRANDASWDAVKKAVAESHPDPASLIDPKASPDQQRQMMDWIRRGGAPRVNNIHVDRQLAALADDRQAFLEINLNDFQNELTPSRLEHYKKQQALLRALPESKLSTARNTLDAYYRSFGIKLGAKAGEDDQNAKLYLDSVARAALAEAQEEKTKRLNRNVPLTEAEINDTIANVMKVEARNHSGWNPMDDEDLSPDEVPALFEKHNLDVNKAIATLRRQGIAPTVRNLVTLLRRTTGTGPVLNPPVRAR